MKPADFAYASPDSLDDALSLIGEDAPPLAGGQSLMPMLNFRLIAPSMLVDLNRIGELSYLRLDEGVLRIGALTRQAALERSREVERGWPLLQQAVRLTGHAAIRSRGTVGGSVVYAHPAAELPAALVALGARFVLRSSAQREREVTAEEMFLGPMRSAVQPRELLIEIVVPPPAPGAGTAFVELSRTSGGVATAGVAVVLAPGEAASVAIMAATRGPMRTPDAERALIEGVSLEEAAELVGNGVTGEYRRAVIQELARRAIRQALS
jgi:CO/xanthine dehydrogenase FAD-binding subunit